MSLNDIFSGFLLFYILQTLVSIFILTLNRYHRIPNLILLALFILIVIHYSFYLFEFQGVFRLNPFRASAILPFQLIPSLLIYLYFFTRIHGNITGVRDLLKYFLFFYLAILFFIPIIIDSFSITDESSPIAIYSSIYRVTLGFGIVAMYIYYAHRFYQLFLQKDNGDVTRVLKNMGKFSQKYRFISILAVLLTLCGLWFLFGVIITFFRDVSHQLLNFLVSTTLFLISIILSFIFIKNPKKERNQIDLW